MVNIERKKGTKCFFRLVRDQATKADVATLGLVGLQPEHAGAVVLVVSRPARHLLNNLHDLDQVPEALGLQLSLLALFMRITPTNPSSRSQK